MRKSLSLLLAVIMISLSGYSQLTGIKTIPGDYATIAAAISDLNISGVGSGGVTFNVTAGYTESFTALNSGLITTTTSSMANPVIFQKSGAGANPVITGFTTGSAITDYIICIAGTDYITFNGIDITEPSAGTEWGFAILKASASDGSQNVTIKNCSITLNKTNLNTVGIYSNNVTPASPGSPLTITSVAGTNSYNKIFNNTISNVYSGIIINGYNDVTAPFSFYDQSNAIGKDGANTITDFGGSTAAKYGIFTIYQNGLKIANNTISGTVDGTGACAGIQLNTASNANTDLTNNTISIQYTSTTGNFYGIYNNMGTVFTTNNLSIYNNIITNCTFPNATSGSCYYIYNTNSAYNLSLYDNQITNNIYGSATATATGTVYGIYSFGSPTVTTNLIDMHGNIITGNSRVQSVVGSGTTYYLYPSGGGPTTTVNIYDNLISNNANPSTGTTAGIYFLTGSTTTSKSAFNNTITNIQNLRGTFYGIYTGNGGTTRINNNKIQGVNSLGATGTLNGIYLSSSTGNGVMNVYNNIVGELYAPSISSATAIYGIYAGATSTTTVRLYHNTVYLSGASTGANFGSSGLYVGTSPSNVIIMNNIINNTIIPAGTGLTVALRWGSNNYTNFSSYNNSNNYYAGTPGSSNLIFYDGASSDQTLESYKTRFWPREGQSVTELTPFVNTTTTPYDLHVNVTVPSQCESAAMITPSPLFITADFDNDPRYPEPGYPVNTSYPPTNADLGADEFGGIPLNVVGPTITYTPFMNTASLTPRTLTATIIDAHGVPVSGIGLPRIAWKKNFSGTWSYATGASIGSDQYTFTFGGGVALGDTVHYYVVAQDNFSAPAVGTYPFIGTGNYSTNPPASDPPSAPSSYKIVPALCGTYTVGVGQTYPTLTAAITGIRNSGELACPVTLLLTDEEYTSETYPIIIHPLAGASATSTLTIKPAPGVTPEFVTSYLGISPNPWSQISLNGAQWIIFDGSNTPGGSDRSLTFRNTAGAGFAAAIGLYNNGTVGAGNIVIKNCVIQAHEDQVYNAQGIVCYSITGNAGYHDLIIDNNAINSAKYAVQITGIASNPFLNAQVTNNSIGSMTAGQGVGQYGVSISYADNVLVQGNEIIGIPTGATIGGAPMGVSISSGSTNVKVRKNIIHDIVQNGTAFPSGGSLGIYFSSDATSVTEISNNVIYNIKSPGQNLSVTGGNTFGILAQSGGNLKIYHNTIHLAGNYMSATVAGMSSCLGFGNNLTLLDVRDNILKNSSMPVSGTPSSKSYCITAGTNTSFTTINYNDYYSNGNGPVTGYIGGADRLTLADWQTATTQDGNSIAVDPLFTSPTYLFPTTTSMNNAGTYFSLVPTDIVNVTRSNPPDMGAYEFATDPLVVTTGSSAIGINTANVHGTINPQLMIVDGFFDYGLTTAYGNSVPSSPATVAGNTATPISAGLTGLLPLSTYHFRARGIVDGSGLVAYGLDMTFTTLPSPPDVITTAATAITSNSGTLNGTVDANGGISAVSFEWGLTNVYGTTVTAVPATVTGTDVTPVSVPISGLSPDITYHYRAVATNAGGTTYGNDMTFVTNGVPATVTTSPATNVAVTTATINGTVNANLTPTSVTFEWGNTLSYGNTIAGIPANVTGNTTTPVTAELSGLTPGGEYHFRCVGTNSGGIVYGLDQMFMTDCPAPVTPGAISGPQSVCENTTGVVYSVSPVPGATGYFWTVPAGATITSGANTISITVDFSFAAVSGNITVAATNACGSGPAASLAVTVNDLPVPIINGPAVTCLNATVNYITESGMTAYVWSITGGTITSGSGTHSVMVTWNSTGNKTISVTYTSVAGCNPITPTTLAVFVDNLPTPSLVGNTTACANSDLNVYTSQTGFSNYIWTVTSGGTIVTGQGTYQIEVDWNVAGTQTVSVNYANASGCSAPAPANLVVNVTAAPGAAGTISGTPELCAGSLYVSYSVAAIPNALNYFWTLPAGASIVEGENTNSIKVDFALDAVSGNISVYASNLCGTGTPSPAYAVTVNPIPPTPVVTIDEFFVLTSSAGAGNQWYFNGVMIEGANGQFYQAEEEGTYYTIVTVNGCVSEESNHVEVIFTGLGELKGSSFSIFPIPNDGKFTATIVITEADTFSISVYNELGMKVYEVQDVRVNGKAQQNIDLSNPAKGIYTVVFQGNNQTVIRKVLVTK